jgi:hypothetical protein
MAVKNCIMWSDIISAPQGISIGADSKDDEVGGGLGRNSNAYWLYYGES